MLAYALTYRCARWKNYLGSGFNQIGVPLDLGGNAHIDVLVSNGHNQTAQQSWINICLQQDGLAWFQEFLQQQQRKRRKTKRNYYR